jgi:hypothetical protein
VRSTRSIRTRLLFVLVLAVVAIALLSLYRRSSASASDWRDKVDSSVLSKAALGQTEFLIYMTQPADLSGAEGLQTKTGKGQYVYERLTAAGGRHGGAQQLDAHSGSRSVRSGGSVVIPL